MLLKLQGHGQQSFIESIGGEEFPAASGCIALLAHYGFNSCDFCAVSSGETIGHQRPLLLPRSPLHMMQHGHNVTDYSVASHTIRQLDSDWSLPISAKSLDQVQCRVTESLVTPCQILHATKSLAIPHLILHIAKLFMASCQVLGMTLVCMHCHATESFMTPCWLLCATECFAMPHPILAMYLI